ncbi:MAG: NADH-quinone oxidoreductase subunit F, partial [Brooklawnia sp.]
MSIDVLTPVLSNNWDQPEAWKLATYEANGGYQTARNALRMVPDDIVDLVKNSGLRGRGGAGFPTGVKWSFLPKDNPNPKYLVVNCDESEPGTCKDIPMLMATPHTLLEGIIISSFAVGAHRAFIYIRGEVLHPIRRLQKAVADAYEAGYLGKGIFGTDFDLDVVV